MELSQMNTNLLWGQIVAAPEVCTEIWSVDVIWKFSWLQPGVYYGVPLVLVLCHHQFRDEELDTRPLTPSQCSSCGRCAGWMSIGCILSFHMFSWCWLLMSTVDWCSEMMWDVLSLGCTVFIARGLHRRLEPVRCPNKVPEQWFLKPVALASFSSHVRVALQLIGSFMMSPVLFSFIPSPGDMGTLV